jgi:SAM-dependent methyltransferase
MTIKQMLRKVRAHWLKTPNSSEIEDYIRNGRRPWSRGYLAFRDSLISQQLQDAEFLQGIRTQRPLPSGYGAFLDERTVEYPWLFAHMQAEPGVLLDAGSVLNFPHLIQHPRLQNKNLSIVTLAPEACCFWQRSISYLFADLRQLPFRDNHFDQVFCISTLEHVGKDNATYTTRPEFREDKPDDFQQAVRELKRVCKKGGQVLISVPFGKFTDFGWYQQFDAPLLNRLIEAFAPARLEATYFRYVNGGWTISDQAGCADCEGFNIHETRYMNPQSTRDYDPDFAAASRGIAALKLCKEA